MTPPFNQIEEGLTCFESKGQSSIREKRPVCCGCGFFFYLGFRSSQPVIIPNEKIRNIVSVIDVGSVQNNSFRSTIVVFWKRKITASPARAMLVISLAFMFTSYRLPAPRAPAIRCSTENPLMASTTGFNISYGA
jgi:hypothetical protein